MHNKILLLLLLRLRFFSSVYLFSYSFCIHYQPPLCILIYYYYSLVTKDDLILSLYFAHIRTLIHSKRIFIYIAHITKRRCRQCIFFCFIVIVLSLSLYVDSYLLRFVQERKEYNKPAQRVDKLFFYTFEYVCVCVLPLTSTHFFLYILSIFPFFTPFCNRQMKIKKKNALNTYVVSRMMRPSVTKNRRRHFACSCFFFFLSVYLFRLFFPHCMIRVRFLVLCPNGSNSRFFVRLLLYCVVPLLVHNT